MGRLQCRIQGLESARLLTSVMDQDAGNKNMARVRRLGAALTAGMLLAIVGSADAQSKRDSMAGKDSATDAAVIEECVQSAAENAEVFVDRLGRVDEIAYDRKSSDASVQLYEPEQTQFGDRSGIDPCHPCRSETVSVKCKMEVTCTNEPDASEVFDDLTCTVECIVGNIQSSTPSPDCNDLCLQVCPNAGRSECRCKALRYG